MKFLFETAILLIFALTALYLYTAYWDEVRATLFGEEQHHTIYLGEVALEVTVADEYDERVQGLSGVEKLKDFEGKLFIFNNDAKHGIWMKDMLIPLDIIWIDKNLRVIHIEENVSPDTYPSQIFAPQSDARFVLEMNAHFASSVRIEIGDVLMLPPSLIPRDIANVLQQ